MVVPAQGCCAATKLTVKWKHNVFAVATKVFLVSLADFSSDHICVPCGLSLRLCKRFMKPGDLFCREALMAKSAEGYSSFIGKLREYSEVATVHGVSYVFSR